MTRRCLALLLSTSIGCGASWPAVKASGEPSFAAGHTSVRTIDVMPADVQVWARTGEEMPEDDIGAELDARIAARVPDLLADRGYRVGAALDWNGVYDDGHGPRRALSAQQMIDTAWALSSYGAATDRAKRSLVPHLPHRLGAATGSDATLYIGGWAYAGKQRESNAKKALKVVVVILIVAAVVVTIAAIADGKGGSIASGAARAGGQVAKTTGRVAGGIGRAAIRIGSTTTRALARAASSIDTLELNFNIGTSDSDCFGRVDTHAAWYRGRPNYYAQPSTPSEVPSATLIEMILVDNRRGVVLWHARQRFPADPKSDKDVEKMMSAMLAAMPEAAIRSGGLAPGALATR